MFNFRVVEVKYGVVRAVYTRHAQYCDVVPTNSRLNVFTTHDVDNILDSMGHGNLSHDEFHGYALSMTNHFSCNNTWSVNLTHHLPSYRTLLWSTPVELSQTVIFAPKPSISKVGPTLDVQGATAKDQAWMSHVSNAQKNILKHATELGVTPADNYIGHYLAIFQDLSSGYPLSLCAIHRL